MDDDRIVSALRQLPPDEPIYRPPGVDPRTRRRWSRSRAILQGTVVVAVVLTGILAIGPILERGRQTGDVYPMYKGGPGRTGEASGGGPTAPAVLWTVDTEPGIDSSPVVVEGTVVIVDGRDDLLALDLRTGAVRWTVDREVFVGSPAVAGSLVVSQTDDGTLAAFDIVDGTPAWRAPLGIRLNSSPLVLDGMAVAADEEGAVHAVSAVDGSLQWDVELGPGLDRSVAGADGLVFAGSDGAFVALDAQTGREVWSHRSDATSFATPAVRDGVVYASGGDGRTSALYAIDATTGAERWRFVPPGGVGVKTPSIDDDTVYLASEEQVFALDRTSGDVRWTRDLARQTRAAIGIDGDTLFLFSQTRLHALDAATGADRWDVVVGGLVDSGTTVVGGLVVAGTSRGRVLAIGALPD